MSSSASCRRWAKVAVASPARIVWQKASIPLATAEFEPLLGGGFQLALLGEQRGAPAVQVLAFALELGQRDDLGQVGI